MFSLDEGLLMKNSRIQKNVFLTTNEESTLKEQNVKLSIMLFSCMKISKNLQNKTMKLLILYTSAEISIK